MRGDDNVMNILCHRFNQSQAHIIRLASIIESHTLKIDELNQGFMVVYLLQSDSAAAHCPIHVRRLASNENVEPNKKTKENGTQRNHSERRMLE